MKVKQHVYITDMNRFLAGDISTCIATYGYKVSKTIRPEYYYCGEVELEINIDKQEADSIALEVLKIRREEAKVALAQVEKELLCIEHE